MDSVLLSACSALDQTQKRALQKGNILNVADLLLTAPDVIVKRCRLSPSEVRGIVDSVCKDNYRQVRKLENVKHEGAETFTTGDSQLDGALGGGIRTGMIWEVVGESAAGKTQLALQLALAIQIPRTLGGLSGSTCFLVTSSTLPTTRLVQISEAHPLLSPSICNLANIHTLAAPTIPILLRVLSETLPNFLKMHSANPSSPPVKLLVIDALAELFHSSGQKTSTTTLVERSKNITEVSTLLHSLASTHQMAILVLNEVSDAFERGPDADADIDQTDVLYRDQARWFCRAHSIPGEDRKEATLGLVWANQVNARILLSRTGRRRYQDQVESLTNKQRISGNGQHADFRASSAAEQQATLIRRLTVIFSSVGRPRSLDYIVTTDGISTLRDDNAPLDQPQPIQELKLADAVPQADSGALEISPLDVGSSQNREEVDEPAPAEVASDDEWEWYWKDGDIPDEIFKLDALADPSAEPLSPTIK